MGEATLSLVPQPEASPLRRCARCRRFFSPVHFHKNKNVKPYLDGLHGWCKICRSESEKKRRADPERVKRHLARRASDLEYRAQELLKGISKRCKREGWEFDLDVEWVMERLAAGRCQVSDYYFDFSAARGPYTPSVDRVIAGAGYTKRNCRLVLMCVNSALMDWGLEFRIEHDRAFAGMVKPAISAGLVFIGLQHVLSQLAAAYLPLSAVSGHIELILDGLHQVFAHPHRAVAFGYRCRQRNDQNLCRAAACLISISTIIEITVDGHPIIRYSLKYGKDRCRRGFSRTRPR